jgi:hypothetical protein
MMSRLRALAEKVLQREHDLEHGMNTPPNRVHGERRPREHAYGVNSVTYQRESGVFTCSFPERGERVNTLVGHEHGLEHGVDTVCRHCGEPIDWRPSAERTAVPFADGSVGHLACADAAEVARIQAATRRPVAPELAADEAEVMIRGEIE